MKDTRRSSSAFKVGDLVVYSNPRNMVPPTLGIVIAKHHGISIDTDFFSVLLVNGKQQILTEDYLTHAVQNATSLR